MVENFSNFQFTLNIEKGCSIVAIALPSMSKKQQFFGHKSNNFKNIETKTTGQYIHRLQTHLLIPIPMCFEKFDFYGFLKCQRSTGVTVFRPLSLNFGKNSCFYGHMPSTVDGDSNSKTKSKINHL